MWLVVKSRSKPQDIETLATNYYWDRVWILQEIGKAQRVEILLLEDSMRWENFVTSTEGLTGRIGSTSRDLGPLRLAE